MLSLLFLINMLVYLYRVDVPITRSDIMRLLEEIKNEEQSPPAVNDNKRIVVDHPEFTIEQEVMKDNHHSNNDDEETSSSAGLSSSITSSLQQTSETRKQVNSLLSSLSTELQRLQLYRTMYESSSSVRPLTTAEQQKKEKEKEKEEDEEDLENKENQRQGQQPQSREKEKEENNRPFSPSDFMAIPAFLKVPDSLGTDSNQHPSHQKQQSQRQQQQQQQQKGGKQIAFPPRRPVEADNEDSSNSPRFFLPPIRLGSSQQPHYDNDKPSSTSSSVFGSAREMINSRGRTDFDVSVPIDSSNPYAVRRRVKQPKPSKPSGASSIHRSPRRSAVQNRPNTEEEEEEEEYEYDVRKSYEGDEMAYDVDEGDEREGEAGGFAIRAMYDDEDVEEEEDEEEGEKNEKIRYSKVSYEDLLKEKKKLELLQKVREFVEI
jgi:type II secretory pathway pseudopilin PulG